jgi:uncharacterized protein (DUF2164 family)
MLKKAGYSLCPAAPLTCQLSLEPAMTIELSKEDRQQAIESIQRYFAENMDEPIGNITAGALLGFFLEEIAPCVYNRAVADARERLQSRLDDLEFEVHEDVFSYWRKFDKKRKPGS